MRNASARLRTAHPSDQAYVFRSELILAMRKGGTRRAVSATQVPARAADAS